MMFDRIRRRHNHKRPGEQIGHLLDRHLLFIHRFKQGALCLRRRPIDFIGQNNVGEDWTGLEFELVEFRTVDRHTQDVGRQTIASELDTMKFALQAQAERYCVTALRPTKAELTSKGNKDHKFGKYDVRKSCYGMRTLQDLLPEITNLEDHEAIRWSSGFRTLVQTYADLQATIGAASNYFDELGIRKGDRVLIWAENRLEWVAVLWACIASGVIAVPVDFRFSE